MNTIKYKAATWVSLLTMVVAIFISPISALATTVSNEKIADYVSTWHLTHSSGIHWTDSNVFMKRADGQSAFCIEHGVSLSGGSGFTPSELSISQKDRLALIAYYGYQLNPTPENYGITQAVMWQELGDTLLTTNLPNFNARRGEILAQVSQHSAKPSFNNQTIELNVGDSITLTDTAGVLSKYQHLVSNTANLSVTKNGNTLTLTATVNSNETGKLEYNIAGNENIGQSFVYEKTGQQKIATFKLANGGNFGLNIKVNLNGNVAAKKIDEETGLSLPNAKLKFEYNGQTKELLTDASGLAQINDIKAGTKVTITEVEAPNGYVNKGEIKVATIEPNKTIEVILNNKEQLGEVTLSKIGREFGTSMFNQYYSLNGAVYGVYSADGQKVGTMTTNADGTDKLGNLKLGSYYAQEETAPAGYLLNDEKIHFDLTYAGQNVELTTTAVQHKDEEQTGNATLIKEDTKTGSIPQGAASLDGAVYELRRTSNDEVVDTVTIKNGKASVTDLYLDDYYWLETKAPEGYLLDEEKHPFQLAYAGQTVETATISTTVKETVITGGFDLVKYGNYDWTNFLANLFDKSESKPLENVEFSVFSDTTGKLVQKGLTDKEGYLSFKELPYDTYTVKETKTPEGYTATKDFKVTIKEQNETHHYAVENKVIEETLKVVKVDAETEKTIPRSDAAFQIRHVASDTLVTLPKFNEDGETDIFYTNIKGYLILPDSLPYGDYELIEVQAPEGYLLAKEPASFTVDGSHDGEIEIRFKDMSQKGVADFTKTGQTPKDVTISESDYGSLYEFVYDYQPLAGVTYQIEATEDITTNDGTVRIEKGQTVATLTTDENGQWQTPELYLGHYQAIEVAAPEGYVLDSTPIEFELKYAGQLVELASTSLTTTNDFQSLNIRLFKQEEQISGWENNQPIIEEVAGNQKVFGIFTRDAQVLSDSLTIPADALVGYQTVKDGVAEFETKLPQGNYYLKELEAGETHIADETEYNFSFTAETNQGTFPIHIYQDTVAYGKETLQKIARNPLVNRLHFNRFTMKKVNESATFDPTAGISFDYSNLGTGAVFTLEDETGTVLQEVTVDKEGLAVFDSISVGTFFLKEKAATSDNYRLSEEKIRIESTKDGIQAFDKNTALLGEQSTEVEETTILFELKNYLMKGTAELTKTDVSTGDALPDTGIRILDQDQKVLIEGRTDSDGKFTFENLPKGTYYFQEFDAPEGYQLDETPIAFEIKEDGEIVKCNLTNKKTESTAELPQTGETSTLLLSILGVGLLSVTAGLYYFKRRKAN